MTAFTIPIPRYQRHKRVSALRIKSILPNPRGWELHFEGERFCPALVDSDWFERNGPQPGGYVVWDDAGASFMPADVFEAGYTLIEELQLGFHDCKFDQASEELGVRVGPATQAAREVGK